MSAADSKKIVLEFIKALSNGDVDGVTGAMTEDITWWLPGSLPVSGTYTGKKEILEDFFGTAFPFFEPDTLNITVQRAVAEEDSVAVEWQVSARTAKGMAYDNYYHVSFDLRDGKICAIREYLDSLYAKEVLFA
jgi:uncharacterized protein